MQKEEIREESLPNEDGQQAEQPAAAEEQTAQEDAAAQETQEQPEGETPKEPAEPEKTETELLQEQIEELKDQLLRTMAEYSNFRNRSQREKDAIYPQATAAAVSQFLPLLDNFERALAAPCSDENFKKGIDMLHHAFLETLKKLGVEEFGEAGEEFDPERHNAVMHIDDESMGTNVIVEVFQKGYRLGDRIVRHAMVKVAN